MNRRKFLGSSILLPTIPYLRGYSKANKYEEHLFANKKFFHIHSGEFRSDQIVGTSILKVKKPNQVANYIEDKRNEFNYLSELKYSSTDKYKLNFCKSLIDYFVDEVQGKLVIKLVFGSRDIFHSKSPSERRNIEVGYFGELLDEFNNVDKVFFKLSSYYGPSNQFVSIYEDTYGIHYKSVKGKHDDIMQLGDFISGSVINSIKGQVKSSIKVQLIDYLKLKLGIETFTPFTNLNNKIILK